MVGEEVEQHRFNVVPHAVELDALVVVYVQVLFLGHCEHRVVLQETNVTNFFFRLKLSNKSFAFPLKHRQVTFSTPKQKMFSIPCHIKRVRPEIVES
jgi:hypothetical protein